MYLDPWHADVRHSKPKTEEGAPELERRKESRDNENVAGDHEELVPGYEQRNEASAESGRGPRVVKYILEDESAGRHRRYT